MPLMSRRAYARLKKISHVTVQEYIAKGHISFECFREDPKTGKLLLDSKLADQELIKHISLGKSMAARTQGRMQKELADATATRETKSSPGDIHQETEKTSTASPADTEDEIDPPTEFDLNIAQFQKSKAATETHRARKLELEIAEREGRLLDAEDVRKKIFKMVGETKEKLLNMPSKISPELVSMDDPIEIENKIRKEIDDILENLSRLT